MKTIYYTILAAILLAYLPESMAQNTNFEDFDLESESYWNGSDGSGSFTSNSCFTFANSFTDWGGGMTSWSGFAYSNMTDRITAGYGNQYSSFAGSGAEGSEIFALCYVPADFTTYELIPQVATLACAGEGTTLSGMYITNNTYAALAMQDGNAPAKEFGGESGDDPDFLKVLIRGWKGEELTDSLEVYLADYRFNNNARDYILDEWLWVDLSPLGSITAFDISMASSDMGDYGVNTPTYVCFDNLNGTAPEETPPFIMEVSDNQVIQSGESVRLQCCIKGAVPPYTFSWMDESEEQELANTDTMTVSPTETTTYRIKGTSADGTYTIQQVIVTVQGGVSVNELAPVMTDMYPNPCREVLNLTLTQASQLSIKDLTGKILINQQLDAGKQQVDVSKLSSGLYLLTINGQQSTKLIKR